MKPLSGQVQHLRPRITMWVKSVLVLAVATFTFCQVAAAGVYIAELMVNSNVTLESSRLMGVLKNITELQITYERNAKTVTLLNVELTAECVIIGDDSTCECSAGYTWSNEVCYTAKTPTCCNDTVCKANVSHITPLCVAKVKVSISGTLTLSGAWSESTLLSKMAELNGFQGMNATVRGGTENIVDFEADFTVGFQTSRLQAKLDELKTSFPASSIVVNTLGLVTISAPNKTVCYNSSPMLKCTFKETSGSAGWNMSRNGDRVEINSGSVVKLNYSCATSENSSCVAVTLSNVTGNWEGIYECGFTSGSVRHTAKTQLAVALLPEEITMTIEPLTADCTKKQETNSVEVLVTATILNSTERYGVTWSYRDPPKAQQPRMSSEDSELHYTNTFNISCKPIREGHDVSITFKNSKGQLRSATVDIPVIYARQKFCKEDGEWPKTPDKTTVIIRECEVGRIGYKERTCEGTEWLDVFSNCVSEQLVNVLNQADDFQQGMGATQEVAKSIFSGLKNNSNPTDSDDSMADVNASITVLDKMSYASEVIPLQEDLFPDFLGAASNMLNQTWQRVNESIRESMSSTYLKSVEGLVKNIKVNKSENVSTENLDLKVCSEAECDVSVFNITVNMNMTSGFLKTVGVKNLMDKLNKGGFPKTEPSSLLISVTMQNGSNSSTYVTLDFPQERPDLNKFQCVFWNTPHNKWSDEGCQLKSSDDNRTVCQCNHLTSFSVLMSKTPVDLPHLKLITNIGLGVSICSLLLLLFIEALVWSAVVKTNLSHFRHTALVNIAVCLFLADCSFLASSSPETLSDTWCLVLTLCKHLFYLAMFGWTLALSVMLVHQLIFVFNPLRKRVFMFFSSIVGYVCPIVIVGASYVYYKYTGGCYHSKESCWLNYDGLLKGSMYAFLLPLGTVLMTNLFSMVVVIVTLMKSSTPDGNKADDKDTAKGILKVVVFLTPVFGITWLFGFAQLMITDPDDPLFAIVRYIFTILNSFQGLFIFLTGCFAEQKVREELFKFIVAKTPVKGKSESMRNLTSTTYSKDK